MKLNIVFSKFMLGSGTSFNEINVLVRVLGLNTIKIPVPELVLISSVPVEIKYELIWNPSERISLI